MNKNWGRVAAILAWQGARLFLEGRIGSIEAGKDADIAVWDQNPYAMPSQEIQHLDCVMTLFRGTVVYGGN